MEIEYIGEHLLPGKLGHFFVVLSFVAALFAAISYFIAANGNEIKTSWNKIGRLLFASHALGVFGVIGTLFYMLLNHYFEYQYIWQHSNTEMPMKYILSSFWEGQEGSFLLWSFWHVILGSILIFTAKKWEPSVLAVICLVQAFLASMLLGIYVTETFKIGSNPFLLLREHADFANLPFIQNAGYLAKLDGRGLNPLLQNYWMTIHPPTLFLGFASTLVPFAFGIAGLWQKKYTEWIKPALPWTFFGVMILGTGILMGGAWAYEALSFGGFWAWDPVENASLVPWIIFVGAAHVMMVNRNRGQSLLLTFILTFTTFLLVLYSTFLTRSGILGDTSVHAFTDLGMSGQLLIYLLSIVVLAIVLLAFNWNNFPKKQKEESIWSREFWMFVGAIVLSGSAFQIIFETSVPVINKVFGTNMAPSLDAIELYNSWQVNFALVVALLIAIGQFFKYKDTEPKKFFKSLIFSFSTSFVLATAFAIAIGMMDTILHLLHITKGNGKLPPPFNLNIFILLWMSTFAIIANLEYFIRMLKGKLRLGGGSIAHVGFALILIGALVSNSQKEIISQNTSGVDLEKLGKDFPNQENIMLKLNDTLSMGDYLVTYTGREAEGVNFFYNIDYLKRDKKGKLEHAFTLRPVVQTNPRMGNVAEPSTKHYLHKDVYTHVTYADLGEKNETTDNEYREPSDVSMHMGDTIWTSNSLVIFEGINKNLDEDALRLQPKDIAIGLKMKAVDHKGREFYAEPVFVIRDNHVVPIPAEFDDLGIKVYIEKVVPEEGRFDFKIAEKNKNYSDFIIMKAIIFPYINILWGGCLIMVIGTVIAIRHRIKTQ